MMKMSSVSISGYRPFGSFVAPLGDLEVLVGANGSGKSSLFEFLKFLRNAVQQQFPPEILPDAAHQKVFHIPGPERFAWGVRIQDETKSLDYSGEILGPIGNPRVVSERLEARETDQYVFLHYPNQVGVATVLEPKRNGKEERNIGLTERSLALRLVVEDTMTTTNKMREYIAGWRFYYSSNFAISKIRQPVLVDQNPVLQEDAANLSAVLLNMQLEHRSVFEELQQFLRSTVPGFKGITIKAYGAPGQVLAFWQEEGIDNNLSLADLSDGTLRLLCWGVLCLQPNLPSLICVDEPDQGVHPRTLPVLAGLFDKASARTQVLLATHSSYFLTQFDLSQIAVMRKENGEAKFIKPQDSQVLVDMLADFGAEEIEKLHRSDELEQLA